MRSRVFVWRACSWKAHDGEGRSLTGQWKFLAQNEHLTKSKGLNLDFLDKKSTHKSYDNGSTDTSVSKTKMSAMHIGSGCTTWALDPRSTHVDTQADLRLIHMSQ